jgi:replicative superfamily II helicase
MGYFQSEAEKLFLNEIREKKRTASGVHHKTGKNGYVGTMRFPSDIMSRKDKMKYRRNGKVMTTNMYDEIITLEEFEKLEIFEKKNRLQYWRNTYTNKEIMAAMGVYSAQFYRLVADLDLPKAARVHDKTKRTATVKKNESAAIESAPPAPPAPEASAPNEKPVVQEIITYGLNLSYNGTFKAEKIMNEVFKILTLLEDRDDDFYIEMKLMQKVNQD